jgi:hypothetical protein
MPSLLGWLNSKADDIPIFLTKLDADEINRLIQMAVFICIVPVLQLLQGFTFTPWLTIDDLKFK